MADENPTMQQLVTRWQRGDLSAARPLIDLLGSVLGHVIAQRDAYEYRIQCLEGELARLRILAASGGPDDPPHR